ncbi:hypothetical protein VNO78_30980 [Psophocarpus tetragonolobus]|uniref:Uncharacterized protein n=1 Tax=Psophocarpus tetragonolobus TaxID=3891 RepID=A0AAN9RXV1_PSOTE
MVKASGRGIVDYLHWLADSLSAFAVVLTYRLSKVLASDSNWVLDLKGLLKCFAFDLTCIRDNNIAKSKFIRVFEDVVIIPSMTTSQLTSLSAITTSTSSTRLIFPLKPMLFKNSPRIQSRDFASSLPEMEKS